MKLGLKEFLFFSMMVALLGSSWFFGFRHANERREALRAEVRQRQQELENLRHSTSGIDDMGRKIGQLEKAIAFFESKLPQEREVDKVLKEVWQLAESNSLECKTIRTLKAEKAANYREQPIEMSLSGDFGGFYNFLLQLEKLPRITRATQINLQKIQSQDGQMTAKLTLSVFFEPDTGGTPPAGAPIAGAR